MNRKLAYSIIFPILVLLFASCSDEPTKGGEEDPHPDGIIYATCDDGKGDGWSEVMTLDGKVLLYRASPKTSTLLFTDVDRQGTATTVVDFDERERLVSIIGDDYCLRGEYEGPSDIGKFTLYTPDEEIYVGELSGADGEWRGASRAGAEFVNFDVPVVTRAIRTYNTIDGIKNLSENAGKFLGGKYVDKLIGDFSEKHISDPLARFTFEAGKTMIVDVATGNLATLPLDLAITMYERGNAVVDALRERAFRKRVGLLQAIVSSPVQLDDDTFEFGISVGGVSTIPIEYQRKTIVGLIYKAVAVDDDDTFVDLFDPDAQIILQAIPEADGRIAVNKTAGRNKKIILRAFIMPATEVPRWQNGLITRSASSIIGYSETYMFINVPVSLTCRQLDMKGLVLIDNGRATRKEAHVQLEFTGRNEAYHKPSTCPILDWGVVIYCDDEEQMRFSLVEKNDSPGDNKLNDVVSTQNIVIDASKLDLDYSTFTATSDRWSFCSYAIYIPAFQPLTEVLGSLQPLELQYEAWPQSRRLVCEINNVRPYDGPNTGWQWFGYYSSYGTSEADGMLFVDEAYGMEYYPNSNETFLGPVDRRYIDGEILDSNHDYTNWVFSQYEDHYWGYWKFISQGREFYSDNCIHRYCSGTLDSFSESIHPGFPGDLFNYTER